MRSHSPNSQVNEKTILEVRTQSPMEPGAGWDTCDMCTSPVRYDGLPVHPEKASFFLSLGDLRTKPNDDKDGNYLRTNT